MHTIHTTLQLANVLTSGLSNPKFQTIIVKPKIDNIYSRA